MSAYVFPASSHGKSGPRGAAKIPEIPPFPPLEKGGEGGFIANARDCFSLAISA